MDILLTIIVMIKTTMPNVTGMVEHVVTNKMMDGIALAQNANVKVSRPLSCINTSFQDSTDCSSFEPLSVPDFVKLTP